MAQSAVGIKITADDAELRAVMKRAAQSTTTAFDSMASSASAFKSVLAGLGVGLSAGYLAGLVKDSIDAQARMKDLAQEAGTTASAISRFEEPARMAGLQLETVAAAMFKMSQAALEAKDSGSKAAQALASIGITTQQLKGLKPDEMFELVARSLGNYSDGLEKNAVMQELFGKSGREMNRVVAEIAEKGKLAATVTDEQAEAADRLQDQIVTLKMESEKLWRGIASDLVPGLNDVVKAFNDGRKQAGLYEAAISGLSVAIEKSIDWTSKLFGDPIKNRMAAITEEITNLEGLIDEGPGLLERMTGIDKTPALVERVRKLRVELAGLQSFMQASPVAAAVTPAAQEKPKPDFDPAGVAARAAAARKAEAEAIKEAERELRRYITASNEADAQRLQNRVDQAAADAVRFKAIDANDKAIQQIQFETTLISLSNDEREKAIALRALETSGINKQDAAYEQLASRLKEAITSQQAARVRNAEELRAQMELIQSQSNFVGAFTDGLESFISGTKSAKDAFKDFVRSIEQQLSRLAAQDIAGAIFGGKGSSSSSSLFSFLSSFFTGGGGLGYGTAGSAIPAGPFPYAKGGVFDSSGVRKFAMGDVFGSPTGFKHAGGMGIMGEAGPEAVMPLARDRSGRLGVRGGGTTVNQVTFNISTPDVNSFRQSESQIAASMHRALSRSARSR